MNAVVEAKPQRQSLITKMAGMYEMEPAKFAQTIKSTCIKGKSTDEQFAAFLMVADKYGLNPLTKEIYAFPQDGGIVPIVGVDGWSRIINDHPQFDGMEFEDHFNGEEIVAITCMIYRADRQRPVKVTEYLKECKRNTVPWKQWPARMLRHKAMIQCARMAFGYTGIIERDEYERQIDAERAPSPAQERFGSLRQEQQRITFDTPSEPEASVTADLDDEIPTFEAGETRDRETVSGEPVDEITETAGAVLSPQSEPAQEPADDAPIDTPDNRDAPAGSASSEIDAWVFDLMAKLKDLKTPEARHKRLQTAMDDPMWFEITDEQLQQLKAVAG